MNQGANQVWLCGVLEQWELNGVWVFSTPFKINQHELKEYFTLG
jgi:hypothetical protein